MALFAKRKTIDNTRVVREQQQQQPEINYAPVYQEMIPSRPRQQVQKYQPQQEEVNEIEGDIESATTQELVKIIARLVTIIESKK